MTQHASTLARTTPPPGPFAGRTIPELAADLRSGRTTAGELAHAALRCIARTDPDVNAFAFVDTEGTLAAALTADRELADGVDRGPLHGLPVGIKDMIDVAGLPTTAGSAHLAGRVARHDATCVRRLRAAGAVIVGKTTTHEFAYGPMGDRSMHGPTRNPRDLTRMSGGSSGGSAAAVAAGQVAYALGTDTGGSVRVPAALCGVAGFKPAYGAIPTDGVLPLARSLDHVGVLAATAADCLTVHRILAATTTNADYPPPGPVTTPRVAWLESAAEPAERDPRVVDVVRRALEEIGIRARHVDWTWAPTCRDAFAAIQGTEASTLHAARMKHAPRLFDEEVLERLRAAATVPRWAYEAAFATRAVAARHAEDLLDGHDLIAMPTVPITAPPLNTRRLHIGDRPSGAVRDALLSLTSTWNLLGLPAFSIPVGTVDGLPVALQLICRAGHEATATAVAERVARNPLLTPSAHLP
ncbi:amidase [Embleya sp. NPDC127516]|uniref:amidase n=1 Tax=Embleya sp. NPDC127516 TaxID=3363990 RepID=UPI0037F6E170